MAERINISSGAIWEDVVGYSRAVKVGNHIEISGTVASDENGNVIGKDNPYEQTKYILQKIEKVLERAGASAVILASKHSAAPGYEGLEKIAARPHTDFRIFSKPSSRPYRRMGVALAHAPLGTSIENVVEEAKSAAVLVQVTG